MTIIRRELAPLCPTGEFTLGIFGPETPTQIRSRRTLAFRGQVTWPGVSSQPSLTCSQIAPFRWAG